MVYKVVSKIIAQKLSKVVGEVVSHNQSGFIRGRNIKDNIMVAQDIVRGYDRSRISPRYTIKVDIHKAYDSVRWDFIHQVLRVMEFPQQFINWIMECITSPTYSININGSLEGVF